MLELSADRCRYAPRQAAALFCPLHFLGRSICICISYCDCKSIFIWICIHICNNICISMSICIPNCDFDFICICVCIWICTRICNSISISICNCVLFLIKCLTSSWTCLLPDPTMAWWPQHNSKQKKQIFLSVFVSKFVSVFVFSPIIVS